MSLEEWKGALLAQSKQNGHFLISLYGQGEKKVLKEDGKFYVGTLLKHEDEE